MVKISTEAQYMPMMEAVNGIWCYIVQKESNILKIRNAYSLLLFSVGQMLV
jgi:hypothetical protein